MSESDRETLLGVCRIEASADATFEALVEAAGKTIFAGLRKLILIPRDEGTVYIAMDEAADANGSQLGPNGEPWRRFSAATAASLHLYAASPTYVEVRQFGISV